MLLIRNILFVILLLISADYSAQSIIQLFVEDFNNNPNTFILNSGSVGGNIGNNKWIINSEYNGQGIKPNTTSQDSTYGGTISAAPYSSYAHIYDSLISSSTSNCNYDNTNSSDRFLEMTNGICTQGMSNVEISFFYICEGTSDAYGELYYNTGSGPWIKTGANKYNNRYKWKYEQVTNPAFDNVFDLKFGFRWVNSSISGADSIAFGIDDIHVVGVFDTTINPVTINITSIDSIVCPGNSLLIDFELSYTLCDGAYHIEMSDATGSFNPPYASWVTNMYYPAISSLVAVPIPFSTPPSACYLFRINRISPAPQITGIASACVEVDACPNVISTTDPPAVCLDTNGVCIYSVIDVPFWSTGAYNTNNIYIAQLSDSSGSFSSPTNIGSLVDNTTYDPALVPSPGKVSSNIPLVPEGCNYYVRVLSSSPNSYGTAWGPFCIRECDMNSNNCSDISVCPGDSGLTFPFPIDINVWDSLTTYYPGNTFSVEILDMMYFSPINVGGLGATIDTASATINLHIPPCDSLGFFGLTTMGFPGGAFYLRIIADSANNMEQTLGCVVHFSIGCPNQIPQNIVPAAPFSTLADTILCTSDPIFVRVSPTNPSSQYMYYINGSSMAPNNPPSMLGIYWTSPGMATLTIQETHMSCTGPMSNPFNVYIIEAPQSPIIGSDTSCINDTLNYWVSFYDATYYNWTSGGTLVDTGNNQISILWDSVGLFNINVDALNQCGNSSNSLAVTVLDQTNVSIIGDTVGCEGDSLFLESSDHLGNFIWINGGITPEFNDVFNLNDSIVSLEISNYCGVFNDTVSLIVIPTSLLDLGNDTVIYEGESVVLDASGGGTYIWTPTNDLSCSTCPNPIANPLETTTYSVIVDSAGCKSTDEIIVYVEVLDEVFVPNLFTPNGDGMNDVLEVFARGVAEMDFRVYDRWGELVFHSDNTNQAWNGTFKGVELNSAVFVYTLKVTFHDGREKQQHGNITLLR